MKRDGICPFTHHWGAEFDAAHNCYYLDPGDWCQDGCPEVTNCGEWLFESGYYLKLIKEDSGGSVSEKSQE